MAWFKGLAGAMLTLALPVGAVQSVDPYDRFTETPSEYDETLEVPWVEIETRVERGPDEAGLVPIELLRLPPGMRLEADLAGLTVDDRDLVSRLWLVVRSPRGGYNATYVGFRCATGEYKQYAHYRPGRENPLRVVRLPRWRPVREDGWRRELMRETLCSDTQPRPPADVRAIPVRRESDLDASY